MSLRSVRHNKAWSEEFNAILLQNMLKSSSTASSNMLRKVPLTWTVYPIIKYHLSLTRHLYPAAHLLHKKTVHVSICMHILREVAQLHATPPKTPGKLYAYTMTYIHISLWYLLSLCSTECKQHPYYEGRKQRNNHTQVGSAETYCV